MLADFSDFKNGDTIAVALSGGSDSMALLHFLLSNATSLGVTIIALNVEHGIRGNNSILDSNFVKDYCNKNNVPLLSYSVDSLKRAKKEKISIEQSARLFRYECFFDAINSGKCDKIATAHHLKDNAETVLLNLFRGTGIKGLTGINSFSGKIIRPFISVNKKEILDYIEKNNIPYVDDETNFSTDYTRNFLRLNVLPEIKKVFPDFENSVYRLSKIAKEEDEFLDDEAKKHIYKKGNVYSVYKTTPKPLFSRAIIIILKELGVEKDWEKIHIDDIFALTKKQNGKAIDLPKNIKAYSEYDKIVITGEKDKIDSQEIPFSIGNIKFDNTALSIVKVDKTIIDVKDGFYLDLDKIPKTAVIRHKKDGDVFKKFGGKTKKLNDYLTDIKYPVRERKNLVLIADGNNVLAIFNIAVSDNTKMDNSTKELIKITTTGETK